MQRNKSNNTTNIGKITYRIFQMKMSELTEKDYPTFTQMYKNLPERSSIKAPKTEFVEKVAKITKKSVKTVRCWIAGTQKPDALAQSVLEKEFKVPAKYLFPEAS